MRWSAGLSCWSGRGSRRVPLGREKAMLGELGMGEYISYIFSSPSIGIVLDRPYRRPCFGRCSGRM